MALFKRKLNQMKFRMTLRKSFMQSSTDELQITKEELNREIQRRNKK